MLYVKIDVMSHILNNTKKKYIYIIYERQDGLKLKDTCAQVIDPLHSSVYSLVKQQQ